MFAEHWIYDFIIYVYALSLLFLFSNLVHPNYRSHRLALGLLMVVWTAQTAFFTWRAYQNYPVLVGLDTMLLYSWTLVTFTLLINRIYRMDFVVFVANMVGFTVLSIYFFIMPKPDTETVGLLLSQLVFIHVTMAFLAYALFSLSAVFAALYLVGNYLLKRKKWNLTLRRLPSLGRLQQLSFRLNLFAIPLLIMAVILGMIWAYQKVAGGFWYDPKIFGSLLVLLAYGVYLYQFVVKGWNGQQLAWWGILSFLTVLVNYFISNAGLSFHQWL